MKKRYCDKLRGHFVGWVAVFVAFAISTSLHAADVNVLIIGSTSDSNFSGKKSTAFSPTEIRTQLANILTGAGHNANVSLINRANDGGYATYSLAQWFHHPYPAGVETTTRWPNLRGEGDNRWDYVILIGDPYTMEYMPGVYAHGVGLVAEEVAKGTKTSGIGQTETVLLMPWPGSTSVSSVAHYKEVVYRAGRTGGHKVAPAALAWEADGANNTVTPTSTRGAYICAASIYSTIWGQSANSGDTLANAVHSTVTTQNAAQQFTGSKMNFQNPYLMLGDKRRDVHFSERGSSTESRTANSCQGILNSLRVTYNDSYRDKYSSSTPLDDGGGWPSGSLPIAWNGGRTGTYNDWNSSVWQLAYEWPHPTNTHNGVATTDPNYDVAAENRIHLAEIYSKDLATAASLVGSDATRRNVPFRLIWGSLHKQFPNLRPIIDNQWHQPGEWISADAAFMVTLYSGRCPVATKPANPDAAWYATKVGYETAWRLGTGSSRAPGFKVMPSAATAKTVTPTTTETMSVQFIFPPTQDVTVNLSVSNPGAASLNKTSMTFTPANYNVAQTVVVSGLTGALATEDFDVIFTTESTDLAYDDLSDSWKYTINRPVPYTVTFNANGGTTPSPTSKSVTNGSPYGTLATTSRTGHIFNGWFTAASGGTLVTSGTTVTATAEHTLYAQWTPAYTVTFNANGGTTPSPTTITVTNGSTYGTLATTSRTSHVFNGWFTSASGGTLVTSSTTVTATANHTLYAQWTPAYTVTFDANGGTTPSPTSIPVTNGSTYGSLATTSRSGHIFNGWFTAASGGTLVTSGTTVTATADHTLYAQWTPTYTVTFNANGGTTPNPTTITVTYGSTYGTLATISRTSYTFNGWFTATSGGTLVTSGTTVTATADHTLYAQWLPGTDGTWIQTAVGPFDWGTSGNWSDGIIADGADRTAYFTPNITATQVINLEGPRTIGNITFTDSTTSSHDLTISGANILTLARTTGTPVIDVTQSNRTLTISSQISGSNGLQKSGAGILVLSGANTYSGATTVNAGILRLSSANTNTSGFVINGGVLGHNTDAALVMTTAILADKNITVNGVGSLGVNAATTSGAITLNDGSVLSLLVNGVSNFNGAVTGAGKLLLNYVSSNQPAINLYSLENTFTGGIDYLHPAGGNFSLNLKSFVDSSTLGAGNIRFGANGNTKFNLASGYKTGGLTLNNRQFDITGTATANLINSSAEQFTINSDLLVNTTGTRTLQLGGAGAGLSTFAGDIANGTADTLNLTKLDGGTWILSGDNTYTGITTVSAGTLEVTKLADGGSNSSIGASTNAAANLLLANNTTLRYTGTGDSTNRGFRINVTTAGHQTTLDSSGSGAINFTNTATPEYGTIDQTRKLNLRGTNTGANTLAANIADNGTGAVSIVKNDAGTWVLGGANSYTGTTTVSAGKLFINGDQSLATGAVSVSAAATLGGSGTIGGSTTIAATGKLEFNLSTIAASHDKLQLATGKTLTFSGASVLTITNSGGAAAIGSYVLVTAPGGITGSAPATLNLPAGWAATVSIVGNDLVLNVTSVGSVTIDHFAISTIASPQTVGTAITGITLTAQNSTNATVTSFTGTVTFGGTAGITGTSANFVNGVLSGVSVTPTVTGTGLTFTVNDGASHTGSATFNVQSVFANWSGGASTTSDSNNDGIANGIAWLLGAANPTVNATALLPTFATDADYFIYTYRRSDAANTAPGTTIAVQYGSTLESWVTAVHDGTDIIITPTDDFYGAGVDKVEVKIKKTLASSGKLFSRLIMQAN